MSKTLNSGFACVPPTDAAPALVVPFPASLQYSVTLGVTSADAWKEVSETCLLSQYLTSMAVVFSNSVAAGMAEIGPVEGETLRTAERAFISGFLGRVQQWLGLCPTGSQIWPTKH